MLDSISNNAAGDRGDVYSQNQKGFAHLLRAADATGVDESSSDGRPSPLNLCDLLCADDKTKPIPREKVSSETNQVSSLQQLVSGIRAQLDASGLEWYCHEHVLEKIVNNAPNNPSSNQGRLQLKLAELALTKRDAVQELLLRSLEADREPRNSFELAPIDHYRFYNPEDWCRIKSLAIDLHRSGKELTEQSIMQALQSQIDARLNETEAFPLNCLKQRLEIDKAARSILESSSLFEPSDKKLFFETPMIEAAIARAKIDDVSDIRKHLLDQHVPDFFESRAKCILRDMGRHGVVREDIPLITAALWHCRDRNWDEVREFLRNKLFMPDQTAIGIAVRTKCWPSDEQKHQELVKMVEQIFKKMPDLRHSTEFDVIDVIQNMVAPAPSQSDIALRKAGKHAEVLAFLLHSSADTTCAVIKWNLDDARRRQRVDGYRLSERVQHAEPASPEMQRRISQAAQGLSIPSSVLAELPLLMDAVRHEPKERRIQKIAGTFSDLSMTTIRTLIDALEENTKTERLSSRNSRAARVRSVGAMSVLGPYILESIYEK